MMRMLTLIALLPTLVALHHVTAHAHAHLFLWSRRVPLSGVTLVLGAIRCPKRVCGTPSGDIDRHWRPREIPQQVGGRKTS